MNPDRNHSEQGKIGGPLDSILEAFETARAEGHSADIDDFLPESGPLRLAALRELVHLDLEHRLKKGEPARVEAYLKRYPELLTDPSVYLGLVLAEFAHRQGCEPYLNHQEYLNRFPDHRNELLKQLQTLSDAKSTLLADGDSSRIGSGAEAGNSIPGYEVLDEIGRGAMGVVYRARQKELQRTVALKMILAGPYASPQQQARFLAEARTVARLGHPHIVQIHEVGEHDGRPFFSLEFVDGGSLDRQLDGTPWPLRHAAALVETLARAMEYAHRNGVIHRDLKPANVLLQRTGDPTACFSPKIADFGFAKNLGDDSGRTMSGAIVGTPSYMAPEQAAGQIHAIGPVTDVYALGAILYELLTGRPPFRAPTSRKPSSRCSCRSPHRRAGCSQKCRPTSKPFA